MNKKTEPIVTLIPTGWERASTDTCPVCGLPVANSAREPRNPRWCEARHGWRRDPEGEAIMLDGDGNDSVSE